MEKSWETKLQEQKQREDRLKQEREQENEDNKRAPHLTNLNEDIQLNGKMYYSLEETFNGNVYIGRSDGRPTP